MVLMRVPRRTVHRSLEGWTFAEDDHLDGRAELIWKLGSADEDRDNFHVGGVSLEHIDVFDANTGRWEPWHASAATIADSARLVACGWSPIEIDTRQGGAGVAYWHVIPEFAHRPVDCRYWCLFTLDENMPGTLGGETAALTRVMWHLLSGPLRELAHCLAGVLTVTPTRDRAWTEQMDVYWVQDKTPWPAFLRRPSLDNEIYLAQAEEAGKPWRAWGKLKTKLERISDKAYVASTRNFRHTYNHRFSPRIVIGQTGAVTRIVNADTKQVSYSFGGIDPLTLDLVVTVLEEQCQRIYQAFDAFQKLVHEQSRAIAVDAAESFAAMAAAQAARQKSRAATSGS